MDRFDGLLEFDQAARLFLTGLGLVLLWLSSRPKLERVLAHPSAPVLAWAAVAVSKITAYLVLYHLLSIPPPSDVPGYYVPWVTALDQGGLPYREVSYAFQPFFGLYLLGSWTLWPDPRTFIVAAIACHLAGLWLIKGIGRGYLKTSSITLLVLLLGVDPLLTGNVLMGQDESYIILLTALSMSAIQHRRRWLAGLFIAVQFLTTKVLLALLSGPLALAGGFRSFAAAAAVVFTGYALVVLAGLDPLHPFTTAWSPVEAVSHGNIPYLLTLLGVPLHDNLAAYDLALLLFLISIFILTKGFKISNLDEGVLIATILMITWTIVSRKSWYEILLIPFLPVLLGRWVPFGRGYVVWLVISILTAINASAWFNIMKFQSFSNTPFTGGVVLFAALELLFVGLKIVVLCHLIGLARHRSFATVGPSPGGSAGA